MKIKLHHVNFCSANVPAMEAFYRDVLDLEPEPTLEAGRVTAQGYAGSVAFVTDGTTQFPPGRARPRRRLPHRAGDQPAGAGPCRLPHR